MDPGLESRGSAAAPEAAPSPEVATERLEEALSGLSVGDVEAVHVDDQLTISIRPRTPTDIRQIVQLAARHRVRVAVTRRLRPGVFALDLSPMSAIDAPDEKTCLVRVGAGAKVREVEARAIQAGMSLGPLLPSSLNKTVGAWLAGPTRGERSIPPGRLETAALALEAVLAEGTFYRSKEAPRTATGPDLDHLLLGGEGRFGIITRATLRLLPRTLVEASAAREAPSVLEAIDAIRRATRHNLMPVEARWDRSRAVVEARFTGSGAAARSRRFGEARVSGREIIRGHLELAGSWRAWAALSPLRPQAFQLVALTGEGAFGAVELDSSDEAETAAVHARAIGHTIVSPRRLRPAAEVGWSAGASGVLRALESVTDPASVYRR